MSMVKIDADIIGLEKIFGIINVIEEERLTSLCLDAIEQELNVVYNELMLDPTIPREYKESIAIIRLEEEKMVILTVMWEIAYYAEYGIRIGFKLYRCPKRRYLGGTLKREYRGPMYLQEYWNKHKDRIINNIKRNIIDMLRLMFKSV